MPPRNFHAPRQLLVQSEARNLIELLNIILTWCCMWLTYCMKKSFLHLGPKIKVRGGGGEKQLIAPPSPTLLY